MTNEEVVDKTAEFVKTKFADEATGHDWWHMYRVWQLAKTIAQQEKDADLFIVEIGALLHDIADWKFHEGSTEAGPKAAREWLESLSVEDSIITHIEDIIRHVSFKGAGVSSDMKTIEGKIIHDADKLDAMGAIGISRTFAYGGANGRPAYDPTQAYEEHDSFEQYKSNKGTTINHFYEKLLLLKERMYTQAAKTMAQERHDYMEQFLAEFYDEWEGKR
ncbi:MAG: metal dependent phosphohydrolase [Candidatus Saccharibacteria bacterium]|nr:metal dependent phosphohydrolase [Candidatus Saccharibacteria bacterium]